jgi:hypothetical protein
MILPPVLLLLGSMASTASFLPHPVTFLPNDSIKVLFPTPGIPVIPIRIELPEKGRHSSIIQEAAD